MKEHCDTMVCPPAAARTSLIAICAARWLAATAVLSQITCRTQAADTVPRPTVVEYFPADSFLRGFSVSPPRISRRIPLTAFGRLAPMLPSAHEPFWTLSQWHCVESLAERRRTMSSGRQSEWRNAYQVLRVVVGEDGRPTLSMTIDSLAVYNHKKITYERMGRVRPHFLLAHNFYPDRDGVRRYGGAEQKDTTPDGSTFPNLDTLSALTLSMKLRLVKADDLRHAYKGDDPARRRRHYNRNCFQFWFRAYCRNPEVPSHGRFFWLGYRAYDSELPYSSRIPHERDQIESDGNATFAYKLCNLSVHGESYERKINAFLAGAETTITIDVLQAARKAIQAIQKRKRAFLDARDSLVGYTLSTFNIGWEPASPFRGTMAISELSLQGTPGR